MKTLIPTELTTRRLQLRLFTPDDWQPLHAHYSDADCTRYTFGRALTEGESRRAMAGMAGHWLLRGFGPYAIDQRRRRGRRPLASGRFSGNGDQVAPVARAPPKTRPRAAWRRPSARLSSVRSRFATRAGWPIAIRTAWEPIEHGARRPAANSQIAADIGWKALMVLVLSTPPLPRPGEPD